MAEAYIASTIFVVGDPCLNPQNLRQLKRGVREICELQMPLTLTAAVSFFSIGKSPEDQVLF